jgi:DnaK suppressor protein
MISASELEERAQREFERHVSYSLDRRDLRELRAIEAALRRIQEGSYGECRECGTDISPARLKALPTAELCVDCAAAAERSARMQDRDEEVTSETVIRRRGLGEEDN